MNLAFSLRAMLYIIIIINIKYKSLEAIKACSNNNIYTCHLISRGYMCDLINFVFNQSKSILHMHDK